MAIEFTVYGIPKAQPRTRPCIRKSRDGEQHAGTYDPGTADDWKALVAIEARKHAPTQPMTGPVRVDIKWLMPRPKRLMRARDPSGELHHFGKRPDRDNLDKAVLDILTQVGWWKEDGQVCCGWLEKVYHAKRGRSGAVIRIEELDP